MSRDIFSLEGGVLDSQHLKALAILLRGPAALRRVAAVAMDKVREEATREVDPLVPRAARQLLLFRQSQLVGRLRAESETALMMLEEGEERITRFRGERNWLLSETLKYMQRMAALLVSQTDKLVVRNPGFATTVVRALHDWDTRENWEAASDFGGGGDDGCERDNEAVAGRAVSKVRQIMRERNKFAWAAQLLSGELIGRVIEPIGVDGFPVRKEHLVLPPVDPRTEQPELLVLLFLLQLVETTCSVGGRFVRPAEQVTKKTVANAPASTTTTTNNNNNNNNDNHESKSKDKDKDKDKNKSKGRTKGSGAAPTHSSNEPPPRERTTTDKNISPPVILACARIVAHSLMWLRDWRGAETPLVGRNENDDDGNHGQGRCEGETAMLLQQALRALRCLLGLPLAASRLTSCSVRPVGVENGEIPIVWSWGCEGFSEETLCEHLTHWALVLRCVRLCLPRSPQGKAFVRAVRNPSRSRSQSPGQGKVNICLGAEQGHAQAMNINRTGTGGTEARGRVGTAGGPVGLETLRGFVERGEELTALNAELQKRHALATSPPPRSPEAPGLGLSFSLDGSQERGFGDGEGSVDDALFRQETEQGADVGGGLGDYSRSTLEASLGGGLDDESSVVGGAWGGGGEIMMPQGLAQESVLTALTDVDHNDGFGLGFADTTDQQFSHTHAQYGTGNRRRTRPPLPPQPHDHCFVGSAATFGSPLVADLLQCCAAVVQAQLASAAAMTNADADSQPPARTSQGLMNPFERRRKEADENFEEVSCKRRGGTIDRPAYPRIHRLLRVSLALGLTCCDQYRLVLAGAAGLNFGAGDMVLAADEEAVAALQLAASALATGILWPDAVALVRQAQELSMARIGSYFVQIACLELLLAGLGAFVQHAITEEELDAQQEAAVERRNAVYREVAAAEREKTLSLLGAAAGLADLGEAPPVHQLTYSRPVDPLASVGWGGLNNNTDQDDGTAAGYNNNDEGGTKRKKNKKSSGGPAQNG